MGSGFAKARGCNFPSDTRVTSRLYSGNGSSRWDIPRPLVYSVALANSHANPINVLRQQTLVKYQTNARFLEKIGEKIFRYHFWFSEYNSLILYRNFVGLYLKLQIRG